jgi:ribosomal protein S18 acetylase RimI-like enzyme
MQIEIREATTDDIPELARLNEEVNNLHVAELPYIYRQAGPADGLTDFLLGLLNDEDYQMFVATVAGDPVGYLSCKRHQAPDHPVVVPRRAILIDNVVVSHAFRRRGIGEALLRRAHAWALAQGIDEVELSVAAFNTPARSLYEKLGYATVWHRMWRSLAERPESDDAPEL